MSSWRDFARKFDPDESERAKSAESAISPPVVSPAAPIGTIGSNGTALPSYVRRGLMSLADAPAPGVRCSEAWQGVVADALRLANEGWVERALSLGWTALDLFGAVTDHDGDPEADGLAVRLAGRKVLAISDNFATVQDAQNGRAYLYRRGSVGTRVLWELGCRKLNLGRHETDGTE